jgi:ribosomal protein S18 acetylase RimI-like enzyme
MPDTSYASAFDGAARIYAENFASLLSIVQPVETRSFPPGIWQHFPNRRKWYRTTDEFYVLQGNPDAVITAIRATDAGPDQVIDVIGPDPSQDDPVYQAAGFSCDDVEILMDRPITPEDADHPDDPRIVDILTGEQIAKLAEVWNNGRDANNYQPIIAAHNVAPGLVHRFIEIDGEAAAYGRAMIVGTDALLCDVNAFPGFRRRGLGRAVMESLHAGLARAAATRVVLTATEMGLSLYEQLGYRTLAQDWIYVSANRRPESRGQPQDQVGEREMARS